MLHTLLLSAASDQTKTATVHLGPILGFKTKTYMIMFCVLGWRPVLLSIALTNSENTSRSFPSWLQGFLPRWTGVRGSCQGGAARGGRESSLERHEFGSLNIVKYLWASSVWPYWDVYPKLMEQRKSDFKYFKIFFSFVRRTNKVYNERLSAVSSQSFYQWPFCRAW